MAQINFDASNVTPDPGRGDPLPSGWYNVAMTKSENKPTKEGVDSSYLECVFDVLDGQHKGRKLFHRFNLRNQNAQAVDIAYKQLSAVMHAVGHLQCGDSSELHGRPLKVRVKVRAAEGTYEAGNDITAFKNINEQVATAPTAPTFTAPPVMPPPVQGWAPPQMPVQMPPQQPMQPPGPPTGWQPPAQAQVALPVQATPPQWTPPPGAPAQPWAAPAPAPQQPAQQAPAVPPPGPPQWTPPPVAQPQQGVAIPPWMQTPPAQ